MSSDARGDPSAALGFLTVVNQPIEGLIGGYLLLNVLARPLEFHCAAPVRANRAQEILYGPTLAPYLYGEQIGRTLVKASKLQPLAVFTDLEPVLATAAHIDVPVWLVAGADEAARDQRQEVLTFPPPDARRESTLNLRMDRAHAGPPAAAIVRCGRNQLLRDTYGPAMSSAAEQRLLDIVAGLDLAEPFERIRSAIAESQRGGR